MSRNKDLVIKYINENNEDLVISLLEKLKEEKNDDFMFLLMDFPKNKIIQKYINSHREDILLAYKYSSLFKQIFIDKITIEIEKLLPLNTKQSLKIDNFSEDLKKIIYINKINYEDFVYLMKNIEIPNLINENKDLENIVNIFTNVQKEKLEIKLKYDNMKRILNQILYNSMEDNLPNSFELNKIYMVTK